MTLSKEKKKVILTRDFNANLLNFDKNKEVNEFLDLLASNWFTSHILGSTKFVEHKKSSLADNIYINFNDMHCTSGDLIEKITNHLTNILIIEGLTTHLGLKFKPLKRDCTHFKKEKLVKDVHELNVMEKLEHVKKYNQKYELFDKNLVEVINKNAPL